MHITGHTAANAGDREHPTSCPDSSKPQLAKPCSPVTHTLPRNTTATTLHNQGKPNKPLPRDDHSHQTENHKQKRPPPPALRILQHLFHTLSDNSTRHHWHTQPRNDLLNQLQHHIHHLEPCLRNSTTLFKGPRNTLLTINKYFRDIHLFLHAHNHSACAWDHVRVEARASLQHLHNLTRTMRR
uniref:Interferon n=1 Tax=Malurus cyaneus samueli TaxID=2593467 RepID=A0A8C5TL33_9PASS